MGARRNAAAGAREETRGWLEERKEGGRGQGGAYAASLYFAGLLQSPIPRRRPPASRVNSPHRHCRRALPPTPATHATLSVEILRILESRMEKRTSLRQKKRNREKKGGRERERVDEAWHAVISSGLLFPLWGAMLTSFTGMPLIF